MYELSMSNVWVIKQKWETDQNTAALFPGADLVCVCEWHVRKSLGFFSLIKVSSLKTSHGMENKKGPKKKHWHYCTYLPAC